MMHVVRLKIALRQWILKATGHCRVNNIPQRVIGNEALRPTGAILSYGHRRFTSAWKARLFRWSTIEKGCLKKIEHCSSTLPAQYCLKTSNYRPYHSFIAFLNSWRVLLVRECTGFWSALLVSLLFMGGPVYAQVSQGTFPPGDIEPTGRPGDSPNVAPIDTPSDPDALRDLPFANLPKRCKNPIPSQIETDPIVQDVRIIHVTGFKRKPNLEVGIPTLAPEPTTDRFNKETEQAIQQLVAKYKNKRLSKAARQSLRRCLTVLIASPDKKKGHGYVNSGVDIRDNKIDKNGILTIYLVVGKITNIDLKKTDDSSRFSSLLPSQEFKNAIKEW